MMDTTLVNSDCESCSRLLNKPHADSEIAQHLRDAHESKILIPQFRELLERCPCGLVFSAGVSRNRHMNKCGCVLARHRRFIHEGCECSGCISDLGPRETSSCTEMCTTALKAEVGKSIHSSPFANNNATRRLDQEMTPSLQRSSQSAIEELMQEKSVDYVTGNSATKHNSSTENRKRKQVRKVIEAYSRAVAPKTDLEKKGYTTAKLLSAECAKRALLISAHALHAQKRMVTEGPCK